METSETVHDIQKDENDTISATERQKESNVKKYIWITAGTLIYAAAISLFLDANDLAPGGVTGIAVILNRFSGIPTGVGILILNIPILIAGGWKFGAKFLCSTVYATVMCSLFTGLFSEIGPLTGNRMLAAIYGGGLMAVGLAVVFRTGTTTGGMDIIIKFLRLRYRHLKTGRLFLMMDLLIVWSSLIVFRRIDTVLFASLAVLICSMVFDMVLYGPDEAKIVYVISDFSESITDRILEELKVGVTHLQGRGAFSNAEKTVIFCVVRKYLMPKLEEIIKEEDPSAFLIIGRANEIYGSGFKNILVEKY